MTLVTCTIICKNGHVFDDIDSDRINTPKNWARMKINLHDKSIWIHCPACGEWQKLK